MSSPYCNSIQYLQIAQFLKCIWVLIQEKKILSICEIIILHLVLTMHKHVLQTNVKMYIGYEMYPPKFMPAWGYWCMMYGACQPARNIDACTISGRNESIPLSLSSVLRFAHFCPRMRQCMCHHCHLFRLCTIILRSITVLWHLVVSFPVCWKVSELTKWGTLSD